MVKSSYNLFLLPMDQKSKSQHYVPNPKHPEIRKRKRREKKHQPWPTWAI